MYYLDDGLHSQHKIDSNYSEALIGLMSFFCVWYIFSVDLLFEATSFFCVLTTQHLMFIVLVLCGAS